MFHLSTGGVAFSPFSGLKSGTRRSGVASLLYPITGDYKVNVSYDFKPASLLGQSGLQIKVMQRHAITGEETVYKIIINEGQRGYEQGQLKSINKSVKFSIKQKQLERYSYYIYLSIFPGGNGVANLKKLIFNVSN